MIFNQQGFAAGGSDIGVIEDVSSLFSFYGGDPAVGHMEIYAAWIANAAVAVYGRIDNLDCDIGNGDGIVTSDSRFAPSQSYDPYGAQILAEVTPSDGYYYLNTVNNIEVVGDETIFYCSAVISEGAGYFYTCYDIIPE